MYPWLRKVCIVNQVTSNDEVEFDLRFGENCLNDYEVQVSMGVGWGEDEKLLWCKRILGDIPSLWLRMRVGWGRRWKIAVLSTQLKITTHSALNISQENDFWRSVISLDEFFFLEPIFLLLFWTFQVRKIKRTGHHLSEGGEGEKSLENIGCVTIELTWSPPPPHPGSVWPPFPSLAVNWLMPLRSS